MSDINAVRQKFEMLRTEMDERISRLWAASEAIALGQGGEELVAEATGLSRASIQAGIQELDPAASAPTPHPSAPTPHPLPELSTPKSYRVLWRNRVRLPGAGHKPTEVKDPAILLSLENLLANEVGGDPTSARRWIRCSLRQVSIWLKAEGHQACPTTVSRLLRKMGYSLKANERKQGQSRANCPERDDQFRYIASQRAAFTAAGWPIISVDTKKKELVGNFRNDGKTWCKKAEEVDEHDFPSAAECRAVPFGVYELLRNRGHVYVGVSSDTPEFAVVSIAKWWNEQGRAAYPGIDRLLILADGGGSNGCRARAWKCNLQALISDQFGLTLTICHYPTGCSKWNPVEHRLFSQISRNWAGKPLRSLGVMLGYIRGTRTGTDLEVAAHLDEDFYKKSVPYSLKDVDQLSLVTHDVCPQWNYTISPRPLTPQAAPMNSDRCSDLHAVTEDRAEEFGN
jgi:hypothetical protein